MKRRLTVVLLMVFCLALCGAGWWNKTKVVIDTESNRVYRYCVAEDVITDQKGYREVPILLTGEITAMDRNGKRITLEDSISCACDQEIRSEVLKYKVGEKIALFGWVVEDWFNRDISFETVKVGRIPTDIRSDEMYYLLDGTSFDRKNATKVTLHEGDVEYYVPTAWSGEKIQHSITEEKLGIIEGYQYTLNKLEPSETEPESLFICYFDNEALLENANDADETELIEKAIVENILGSIGAGKFPSKEVKTYYGADYDYYIGSFKSALEMGNGYHTEFVFEADGEDGIVVILYVYKNTGHLSDVMFVTRFIEIN